MTCEQRYGYPKCMGQAALDQCTCIFPSEATKLERLEKRVAKLEKQIEALGRQAAREGR